MRSRLLALALTSILSAAACGGASHGGGGAAATTGGAITMAVTLPAVGVKTEIDETYEVHGVAKVPGGDQDFVSDTHNHYRREWLAVEHGTPTKMKVGYDLAQMRTSPQDTEDGRPRGLGGNTYVISAPMGGGPLTVEVEGRAATDEEVANLTADFGGDLGTPSPMVRLFDGHQFTLGTPVAISAPELAQLEGFMMTGGTPTALNVTLREAGPRGRLFELDGVIEASDHAADPTIRRLTFKGTITFDGSGRLVSVIAGGDVWANKPVEINGTLRGSKTYVYE